MPGKCLQARYFHRMSSSAKNFIFDFDGTLADSLPLYLDILYRGRTSSPSAVSDEQLARLRQTPLLKLVGQLKVPPFSRLRLLWHRWRHLTKRVGESPSFGNLPQVLQTLHRQGHKLYVLSSNYERNVQAFLKEHNLEKYFSGVYHTNVFRKKRGLLQVIRRQKLSKRATYYIGNEPLDIRAARAAGISSVAVLWSGQAQEVMAAERPTIAASKPGDLLALPGSK